jgi:two-component system, OmpR family, response regulator MtrA
VTESAPCVLVADDDGDILELVGSVLAKAGYDVAKASNGAQALELVRTLRPRVAVLDVAMPELDGVEVLRLVRADPETAELPVILLTARAQEEDVKLGYAEGASKYVRKPFSPRELVGLVRELAG